MNSTLMQSSNLRKKFAALSLTLLPHATGRHLGTRSEYDACCPYAAMCGNMQLPMKVSHVVVTTKILTKTYRTWQCVGDWRMVCGEQTQGWQLIRRSQGACTHESVNIPVQKILVPELFRSYANRKRVDLTDFALLVDRDSVFDIGDCMGVWTGQNPTGD
jgi:hypothetical protein